ncbi:MAG: hypothetical protein LPK07_04895 [Hymenobacteraceae bacterium]|nr:hypothetical protein [Hymenobacteraceae bacterium]MDX5480999.1 hypothetical protein [Hymenobacteraceae bacterium]
MFSDTLPEPILFHPLKHHLGHILAYIRRAATAGAPASLRTDLLTLGTSQLDLYCGPLSPEEVAKEVILYLRQQDLLAPAVFRRYLHAAGADYRCTTLSDDTDWVLRWGVVAGRYVHLHPARYAAHTVRVKAAALKTAIASVVAARRLHISSIDLELVNKVRGEWLQLPPVKAMSKEEGAGKFLDLLLQRLK